MNHYSTVTRLRHPGGRRTWISADAPDVDGSGLMSLRRFAFSIISRRMDPIKGPAALNFVEVHAAPISLYNQPNSQTSTNLIGAAWPSYILCEGDLWIWIENSYPGQGFYRACTSSKPAEFPLVPVTLSYKRPEWRMSKTKTTDWIFRWHMGWKECVRLGIHSRDSVICID
jgi:hypothetical protein